VSEENGESLARSESTSQKENRFNFIFGRHKNCPRAAGNSLVCGLAMNEENAGVPQGIQVDVDQLLAAPLVLLDLPPSIYAEHILPMLLADRESFNNLRSTSKEIYNTSHQLITSGKLVPPWPKTSIELSSRVGPLAFSPNGGLLACGCLDGIIRLWNRHVGRYIILEGHTGGIQSLAFSPDSSVLASASEDHTVQLWLEYEYGRPHQQSVARSH
jgi:hypothetical protein